MLSAQMRRIKTQTHTHRHTAQATRSCGSEYLLIVTELVGVLMLYSCLNICFVNQYFQELMKSMFCFNKLK